MLTARCGSAGPAQGMLVPGFPLSTRMLPRPSRRPPESQTKVFERAEVGAAAGKLLPMPLPGGALEDAAIAAAAAAIRA